MNVTLENVKDTGVRFVSVVRGGWICHPSDHGIETYIGTEFSDMLSVATQLLPKLYLTTLIATNSVPEHGSSHHRVVTEELQVSVI